MRRRFVKPNERILSPWGVMVGDVIAVISVEACDDPAIHYFYTSSSLKCERTCIPLSSLMIIGRAPFMGPVTLAQRGCCGITYLASRHVKHVPPTSRIRFKSPC